MEMVLDRQLQFTPSELDFGNSAAQSHANSAAPAQKKPQSAFPGRRFPE